MEPIEVRTQIPATIVVKGRELTGEQAALIVRRSGGWFYWIAGLSVVNWLAIAFHLNFAMIMGLGMTQLAAALAVAVGKEAENLRGFLMVASLLVTLLAGGTFVFLGYHARKARLWAQIAGAVLYGIDALLFIWMGDWIAVGFHAFVMLMLWGGLSMTLAIQEARAREASIGSLLRG